jgi:hypothetical protein
MNTSYAPSLSRGTHAALIQPFQNTPVINERPEILTKPTPGDKLDKAIDAQNTRADADRGHDKILGALLDALHMQVARNEERPKALGLDAGPTALAQGRGLDRQRDELKHAAENFETRLLEMRAMSAGLGAQRFEVRA